MSATRSNRYSEHPRFRQAKPRFLTRTHPDWPSYGPQVARFGAALGTPFMPHQRLISNHSLEVNPRTGFLAHSRVLVSVPRQSGKSTDGLATRVHRAFGFGEPQDCLYYAQNGLRSRALFLKQERKLRRRPFADRYSLSTNNNDTHLTWDNGSTFAPGNTTEAGNHGDTLDLVDIDEAFAHIDYRIEQSARPAMSTRPNAQLRIYSTKGTLQSLYLNEQLAKARELVDSGKPGLAYIEYSAGPDEDPGDPWTWFGCMPALGWTISLEFIQGEYDSMPEREFRRAYLNQTDRGASATGVIDLAVYDELGDDEAHLVGARCFALDIANDRSWAAVAAAGTDQHDRPFSEVVKYERGAQWVVPYLAEKLPRNRTTRVYLVAGGAAAAMQTTLEEAGIDVVVLNRSEYQAACARYFDQINDRTSAHLRTGQAPLQIAVAGAVWSVSDARVWSRAKSTVDICPLIAATAASWGHVLESHVDDDYDVLSSIA